MRRYLLALGLMLATLLLAACGGAPAEPAAGDSAESPVVTIYKPPT